MNKKRPAVFSGPAGRVGKGLTPPPPLYHRKDKMMSQNNTLPAGLVETGQVITLPLPIYDELLEHDNRMALTSPVIPLVKTVKWADERMWCRHLREDKKEEARTCRMLIQEPGQPAWCALNGHKAKSPCAFAEPATAPIWQQLNAYRQECQARGWPL